MNRRLLVSLNGQQLGWLSDENNIWAFQYSPEWLDSAACFALSPSLPLGPEKRLDGATERPVQ
jgi:serine/threonine-protein kinase HipA